MKREKDWDCNFFEREKMASYLEHKSYVSTQKRTYISVLSVLLSQIEFTRHQVNWYLRQQHFKYNKFLPF
jgi:hypothetical protein